VHDNCIMPILHPSNDVILSEIFRSF